ncbi:hypothetical protein ACFXKX_08365 [Streptomyces scopuliridis]|uniref:hypothetical protein n=1 Tax=Streptomyces scopuliridis TaxID=452529 RepID=UPI0036C7124C
MRTYLSTALIVLLTVLAPLSAVAAWVDLEIGDTDRFVSTMAPLASDPDVQNAVADRITDEVLTEVDVGPLLQEGVRGLLHDAVLSFETTNAFKNAWKTATRAAHATAEQALTSGGGNAVTIDLAPITARVKKQLTDDSVPYANRIPVRHTQIIVLEANGLGIWRDVTQGLRAVGIWPAVGTLALTGAAVLLAVRRRPALIGAGLAYAAGAALLFLGIAVARGSILQDLPDNGDRSAAAAIFDALTASLRTAGWCVLGGGLALALGAWLSGRLARARHTPHIAPSTLRSSSPV